MAGVVGGWVKWLGWSVGGLNGRAKHSVVSYSLRREFLAECFAPTMVGMVGMVGVVGEFVGNIVEMKTS
jgi:hypothetical protein